MKKIALCLAVLLLLFAGCSLGQTTGSKEITLPTIEGKESASGELVEREVLSTDTIITDEKHTLSSSDEDNEPQNGTVLYVAEEEENRRKPSEDTAITLFLPANGTFSFGDTLPLVLSATEADNGTVTVQFPNGNCYVSSGKLFQKTDSLALTEGDTVYVTVKENGETATYVLWIENGKY